MDLQQLRNDITAGVVRLDITTHARVEALKDGLLPDDLEHAAMHGEIVEEHPDRDRVLLLDYAPTSGLPVHVVLEYVAGDLEAYIVTGYVPDDALWHPGYKTRK
jgi:hypothetical protein